ncbi:MAG: RrF2 family transcriptional regulator [Syntrophomonadales bacterium]
MQITRQTEYGIRTLIELAQLPEGQLIASKTISERQEIPETFLHKTLQLLSKAGLVITQRGVQGGVRLALPPDKITIKDILVAIEGPLAINVCMVPGYPCDKMGTCQVRRILARAQAALSAELSRETLADIIDERREE